MNTQMLIIKARADCIYFLIAFNHQRPKCFNLLKPKSSSLCLTSSQENQKTPQLNVVICNRKASSKLRFGRHPRSMCRIVIELFKCQTIHADLLLPMVRFINRGQEPMEVLAVFPLLGVRTPLGALDMHVEPQEAADNEL